MPASRGEVIITQKEAKGEYGSGWSWWQNSGAYGEAEKQPHVHDSNSSPDVPLRMTNFGTAFGPCTGDSVSTAGDTLGNGGQMTKQISCRVDTGNMGNYYNFFAANAINFNEYSTEMETSGSIMPNSICPKGWQLPNAQQASVDKSFAKPVSIYSGISANNGSLAATYEETLRKSPMSIIRSGMITHVSIYGRKTEAYIMTGQVHISQYFHNIHFTANGFYLVGDPSYKMYGFVVRCVAR